MGPAAWPCSVDAPWSGAEGLAWAGGCGPWHGFPDQAAVATAHLAASEASWGTHSALIAEQVRQLQQHVSELERWKRQAEESAQSFGQAKCGGKSILAEATPSQEGSAGELTPLSDLPLPIRVHVGPDEASSAQHASAFEDTRSPGAGRLLPPGLTLARAASLRKVNNEDSARTPALLPPTAVEQAPHRLPDNADEQQPRLVQPQASLAAVPGATEVCTGIVISHASVGGVSCTRVEWRIDDLRGRLQSSMGRPLVSPSFVANSLPNLRLMVFPDAREAVKSARSRERKGMYANMVKKGPLYGSLKLKADSLNAATDVCFLLTVGAARRGPFHKDFSQQAVHGCDDFGVDWLKQVDETSGCLRVGVEILNPGTCEDVFREARKSAPPPPTGVAILTPGLYTRVPTRAECSSP